MINQRMPMEYSYISMGFKITRIWFEVCYVLGQRNNVADALSHAPSNLSDKIHYVNVSEKHLVDLNFNYDHSEMLRPIIEESKTKQYVSQLNRKYK